MLADRAVRQAGIDFATFIERGQAAKMSPERIMELLNEDLTNNGPIFGKFVRSLVSASESAVMTAEQQGALAGYAAETEALRSLYATEALINAVNEGDPVEMDAIENGMSDVAEFTWVATLVNTCHLCLPLHGQTRRIGEWQALGLSPQNIHAGWGSTCQCTMVPSDAYKEKGRADWAAPIVRRKLDAPEGTKVSRRTQRAVMQRDLEKSQAAVAKAMQSEEGRRTLRLMGQINE